MDYTFPKFFGSRQSQTNGVFNIFWDKGNITPSRVMSKNSTRKKAKIFISLGRDTVDDDYDYVDDDYVYFQPSPIISWVDNAVSSLSKIINDYSIDGIDIDYEHFMADAYTFRSALGDC
ncbi:putative chitinase [Dioscorea sansibarensis]